MAKRCYLAVDLGAETGRVVAGLLDGDRLHLDEIHRFANGPVRAGDTLYWDVLGIWREIQRGLGMAGERFGREITSIGVDAWGVDFALLTADNQLAGNPVHYRDSRTGGMLEEALRSVSREEIFATTGVQFMRINTLYQLLSMARARSPLLTAATTFLMIPDLFHWLLTGRKAVEFTNATTTQFFDSSAGIWAVELLEKLGIPTDFLPEVLPPGTSLGPLAKHVADEVGLGDVHVTAPATHDTGSAVAAVPTSATAPSATPDWCYLSSGTWSLMGVEVPAPITGPKALGYNVTNEGGVAGTYRTLKNITGLWLIQECRRQWQREGRDFDYEQLTQRASAAPPFRCLIDPDDGRFLAPGDLPARIAEFCRETGQPVPEDEGGFVRCALEGLAFRYRQVLGWLEELTGGRIETIHVVGGGVQNRLLAQLTADACRRRGRRHCCPEL